ncbi:hypothetical protein DPMN_085315 [Dreissena polymorpha]|uniref:Uncharacterized protein n=1 Tax=Dreissena polymorpha TaxID=45954 RepID=A0A9D3YCI8_DREPO|nr:hypothetical protein DPMN_085315 [Dreissena polymorpha]
MKTAKALPRYGSGHKSAGRPAGWTHNAKTISLRLWRGIINLWSRLHDDLAGNAISSVSAFNIAIRKFAPTPGGQDFLLLTSLYGDWSTKETLTVFTKNTVSHPDYFDVTNVSTKFHEVFTTFH